LSVGTLLLQLPELGELQEDGIRVDERKGESGNAVSEAAAQHVVPEECCRWMCEQIDGTGAPAAFVHLLRGQRAVLVDPIEMVAEVAVRVVLKLVLQLTDRTVRDDRFVDVLSLPARCPPVVQACLMIRKKSSTDPPSR
jgi:hypothetical protein